MKHKRKPARERYGDYEVAVQRNLECYRRLDMREVSGTALGEMLRAFKQELRNWHIRPHTTTGHCTAFRAGAHAFENFGPLTSDYAPEFINRRCLQLALSTIGVSVTAD